MRILKWVIGAGALLAFAGAAGGKREKKEGKKETQAGGYCPIFVEIPAESGHAAAATSNVRRLDLSKLDERKIALRHALRTGDRSLQLCIAGLELDDPKPDDYIIFPRGAGKVSNRFLDNIPRLLDSAIEAAPFASQGEAPILVTSDGEQIPLDWGQRKALKVKGAMLRELLQVLPPGAVGDYQIQSFYNALESYEQGLLPNNVNELRFIVRDLRQRGDLNSGERLVATHLLATFFPDPDFGFENLIGVIEAKGDKERVAQIVDNVRPRLLAAFIGPFA